MKIFHVIRTLFKTDTRTEDTVMRHLRGYVLRNASLGDFVVVRTPQSVLTQT